MSKSQQRIFLVGPMGVGKTTIGKQLASLLDYEFIDSDKEIEKSTGATIPWIFDVEGEEGFRTRESRMIDSLTAEDNIVLATGGGAVIKPDNRKNLMQRGIVVYLKATVEELLNRTRHDKNRPLLQTDNPEQKIRELIEQREPWYLEIADIVFDTGFGNVHSAAQALLEQLKKLRK